MGGGGRQGVEEFAKALKDALDDIRAIGLGAGRAAKNLGELTGATFAANTAMLAIQRFGRDVAFGTIEDTIRHGPQHLQAAIAANSLRAMAALPLDPFQAGELQRPIEAAGNRLSGITGPIARAGGQVDAGTKQQLLELLFGQERRAELDAKENSKLQNELAAREVERGGGGFGSFRGIPSNPAAFFLRMFGVSMR